MCSTVKMHLKCVFLLISMIYFQSVIASETREIVPMDKDHPNLCHVKQYGVLLKYGTKVQVPGKCAEMVCNKNRELTITECYVMTGDPLCSSIDLPQNRGKPFPDCCPVHMCA